MSDPVRDEAPSSEESPVECRKCSTPMILVKVKKHPGVWPYVLIVLGLLFTFAVVGPIIGVPMILLGIYMLTGTEIVSLCPGCGYYFKVMALRLKK